MIVFRVYALRRGRRVHTLYYIIVYTRAICGIFTIHVKTRWNLFHAQRDCVRLLVPRARTQYYIKKEIKNKKKTV